jgi:RecA/RadA recombinase
MDSNREKAIDLAVSQIEKQFGKGAIMKLGEGGLIKDVAIVSTGSLGLDLALGIGGVPRGRVLEIYGPESSGKTTLALHIVAEAQKAGGIGAYIDAEHALDLAYAKKLGVMFGNPETTTGGNALKFYASVRMDIRRIGALKEADSVIGGRTRVKVVKNKMAPPFKEAEFDILYGTGISLEGELTDIGSDMGIVEKSGAWYSFNGDRIGQGRDSAKEFLKAHPDIAKDIREKILDKAGVKRAHAPEPAAAMAPDKQKEKSKSR